MEKDRALIVLQQVARRNGVPLSEAVREIDLAIAEAMASSDPAVRARWDQIPRKGSIPAAVEVVAYFSKQLSENPL